MKKLRSQRRSASVHAIFGVASSALAAFELSNGKHDDTAYVTLVLGVILLAMSGFVWFRAKMYA